MLGSIGKVIGAHKTLAVIIAIVMLGSAVGGVVYFTTQPSTIHVLTGKESFMQTVYFNTTNANHSTEPLQVIDQNGTVVNLTSTSGMFMIAQDTSQNGGSFSLNVNNLTQGEYIVLTVGIKNTGAGKLPFANYSTLQINETGAHFPEGNQTMQWNTPSSSEEAAVAGYYPIDLLNQILTTNSSGFLYGTNWASNNSLWILASGPASGYGSGYPFGNSNTTISNTPIVNYPTALMPGQTVYYNLILGLGTYAPTSYLNQSYTFNISVGAQ